MVTRHEFCTSQKVRMGALFCPVLQMKLCDSGICLRVRAPRRGAPPGEADLGIPWAAKARGVLGGRVVRRERGSTAMLSLRSCLPGSCYANC